MILLQSDRPIPLPLYSFLLCNCWNITKMRSKYCGSMPMPLSRMENSHLSSFCSQPMWIWGVLSLLRYLMALVTRLRNTCSICVQVIDKQIRPTMTFHSRFFIVLPLDSVFSFYLVVTHQKPIIIIKLIGVLGLTDTQGISGFEVRKTQCHNHNVG